MINPKQSDTEKQSLKEFCDFVEATPMTPSTKTKLRIMQRVEAELCPPQWLIFGKLFFIEAVTGVATLFICPQFDLGFGGHNELLHTLHEALNTFSFYLICGLIFVVLGAVISGIFLSRDEIRVINKSKYIYYLIYACTAYFIFTLFGAEVLMISLTAWILGSFMGNTIGFSLATWIRFAPRTSTPI